MGLAQVQSVGFLGLEALTIDVELDLQDGGDRTTVVLVGLPDSAVRESKDRVLAAVRNSGYHLDNIRCTINLAPGDVRKEGPLYDLPIAVCLLRALNAFSSNHHKDYLIVGEMGLNGELRPIHGALAVTMHAKQLGKRGVLLPALNAEEAAAVPGVDVIPIAHLSEAISFFEDPRRIEPHPCQLSQDQFDAVSPLVDFSEVKGQLQVKRAMEIAAAGGHNIILSGPPGCGKSMLAKALIGIMPPLSVEEALEVTKIHSLAGKTRDGMSLVKQRPFRSPHHTVSYAGLIGGGSIPRPGEVALAHHGVLFLDELPEFPRTVLEVLRQPLEDRAVSISRAQGTFTFPTSFTCVAAMNPCPCGNRGHPTKRCTDSITQVQRYMGKISGPLLDRIDLHIDVPALPADDLMRREEAEDSASVRARVCAARQRQYARQGAGRNNATLGSGEVQEYCELDEDGRALLRQALEVMGISARAHHRILKVARTIADLSASESIRAEDLMEAINYRRSELTAPVAHV